MQLLFVRHGETVDNVAGVYAGTTDSPLTNHGMIQARKLGEYLISSHSPVARIFSSDLQRAYLTAEAVRECQNTDHPVIRLACLRERHLGRYEKKKISSQTKSIFGTTDLYSTSENVKNTNQEIESVRSMRSRAKSFIKSYLLEVLNEKPVNSTVVIVSHGIFLCHLWREFMSHYPSDRVLISPNLNDEGVKPALDIVYRWNNTAYLEVEIIRCFKEESLDKNGQTQMSASQLDCTKGESNDPVGQLYQARTWIFISSINRRDHLKGIRKAGGGIGSIEYSSEQKTIQSFFTKKT